MIDIVKLLLEVEIISFEYKYSYLIIKGSKISINKDVALEIDTDKFQVCDSGGNKYYIESDFFEIEQNEVELDDSNKEVIIADAINKGLSRIALVPNEEKSKIHISLTNENARKIMIHIRVENDISIVFLSIEEMNI